MHSVATVDATSIDATSIKHRYKSGSTSVPVCRGSSRSVTLLSARCRLGGSFRRTWPPATQRQDPATADDYGDCGSTSKTPNWLRIPNLLQYSHEWGCLHPACPLPCTAVHLRSRFSHAIVAPHVADLGLQQIWCIVLTVQSFESWGVLQLQTIEQGIRIFLSSQDQSYRNAALPNFRVRVSKHSVSQFWLLGRLHRRCETVSSHSRVCRLTMY